MSKTKEAWMQMSLWSEEEIKEKRVKEDNTVKFIKKINSRVAGTNYKNDDGTSRQAILGRVRAGDTITLVREPHNKFDKNAIKVIIDGSQVGYITKQLAGDIANIMDDGYIITGKVVKKTGFDQEYWGCNIVLFVYSPPTWPENIPF